MKLDFKRNVKRNMLANAASSGIRLLFPFLNRTLFLWLLGLVYLGSNILFVLFLPDAYKLDGIPWLFAKAVAAVAATSLCLALVFRGDLVDLRKRTVQAWERRKRGRQ